MSPTDRTVQGGQPAGGPVVSCPVCCRPAQWEEPPRGPFCSERCRLIDLGAWAEGRYAIPGAPLTSEEPEAPSGPHDRPPRRDE